MADDPDSTVLRMLRRRDEKIDRIAADTADLKVRMTSVEANLAALNGLIDCLDARVERIERRLDLVDMR